MVRFRRPAGVIRTWHAWRGASKNLGDPMDSCSFRDEPQGVRLARHRRGNPDPETKAWRLNGEAREMTGRRPEPRRQGRPKILGKSDQPVVLRERESRSHGEGADGN